MAIRWSVNFENDMVSVQRLLEYANLPLETQNREASQGWKIFEQKKKEIGKIEFINVEMRYKPELRPALKQLSFKVEPGMKVSVVGRTGAGKSSLYQLLTGFRIQERGKVFIDRIDVSKMDVKSLRSEINFVL